MKNIKSIIDETFLAMYEEYDSIFKNFYPGQGKAGFNEANLVQKFMFHYKQTYPSSIVWTELSTGEKSVGKYGRLDGVIIDLQNDALIIIEAKRFNQPRKLSSSIEDIVRATNLPDTIFHLNDIPIPSHRYTLVLGDIWDEGSSTDKRKLWIKSWESSNPLVEVGLEADIKPLQHRCRLLQIKLQIKEYNYHLVYSLFECTKKETCP